MNHDGGPVKKYLFLIIIFFLTLGMINAQNTGNPVPQMDIAIKALAGDLNNKLIAERAQRIALGQFTYRNSIAPLCDYWANQLTEELINIPNRSFTLLSGGIAGADWTISGEIVEAADTIRVYTRLVRSDNRAITAAFHSDFVRNEHITGMLFSADGRGGVSSVPRDVYEPDSWDNPLLYEIGFDDNTPVMNRSLHEDDEDFFLLIPASNGWLVMETTGSTDTYMEFYDAGTRELLDEDDDGGSRINARIRYEVQAGRRYIAKVRGYGSDNTGNYGFRAYLQH